MKRKLNLLLVVLLLLATVTPLVGHAQEFNTDANLIEPEANCWQATKTVRYTRENQIKASIEYWDGVYFGVLYKVDEKMDNHGWIVTYKGVVCDNIVPW